MRLETEVSDTEDKGSTVPDISALPTTERNGTERGLQLMSSPGPTIR